MGTQSAPNILLTIIDIADGLPEPGLAVVIVPYGGSLGVDDIVLSEISSTGKYAKSTANGMDSVDQGVYEVYADSGGGYIFRGTYLHGGDALEAHRLSTSDPHSVTAQQISVTDVGNYFSGANIETVLQEVGVSIEGIPSVDAALLLDSSSQQVSAVKPKVTNLNADKVDGYHAGLGANQLVVLDSYGKVPTANLPTIDDPGDPGDPFYGNADTLDGLHQGQGSGKIPKWNSAGSHNDLDTSLAGKKVTGLNGHLVAMSNAAGAPVANKLHTSFLQKKFPLVAHADNLLIQSGWGYKQGDGTQSMLTGLINFPENFDDSDYIVVIAPLGRAGSAPTVVTTLTGLGSTEQISMHGIVQNKGYCSAYMRNVVNFSSSYYYGYSWIAIGIKA